MIHTIGFIGAGAAASALVGALSGTTYRVAGVSSRGTSATRLAAAMGVPRSSPERIAETCDLTVIATPDDAIGQAVRDVTWRRGSLVVHLSGSQSLDVLSPAAARGARTGSIHPMQTFASSPQLEGVTFGIEGSDDVYEDLAALTEALGGRPMRLTAGQKAAYHLAGTLSSNFLVALIAAAADVWVRAGLVDSRADAVEALLPLVRGTVENLATRGLPAALTGPAARGDGGTVARHLDAAERWGSPALAPAYRALTEIALEVARERGLDPEAAARVTAALNEMDLTRVS